MANIITRVELGNQIENFKTDILNTISNELDTIKVNRKHEAEKAAMVVFFPKCRQKHVERECPLNSIEVCGIYTLEHQTKKFPSLLRLQAIYKGNIKTLDQV